MFLYFLLVTCPPVNLSNGRVTYDRDQAHGCYPIGTMETNSCNDGYSRSGWRVRTCQESREWDGTPAVCTKNSDGGGCFPSVATVMAENGKSIAMSELQTGDHVKTGRNIRNSFQFNKSMFLNLNSMNMCQWRIQDFPKEGAPTPRGGRQPMIFSIFAENCMKMKKFWPPGGRASPAPPLDLPLCVTLR